MTALGTRGFVAHASSLFFFREIVDGVSRAVVQMAVERCNVQIDTHVSSLASARVRVDA